MRTLTITLLAINNLVLGAAVVYLINANGLVDSRLDWLRDNYFDVVQLARENDYLVHSVIDYLQTFVQPLVLDSIR